MTTEGMAGLHQGSSEKYVTFVHRLPWNDDDGHHAVSLIQKDTIKKVVISDALGTAFPSCTAHVPLNLDDDQCGQTKAL